MARIEPVRGINNNPNPKQNNTPSNQKGKNTKSNPGVKGPSIFTPEGRKVYGDTEGPLQKIVVEDPTQITLHGGISYLNHPEYQGIVDKPTLGEDQLPNVEKGLMESIPTLFDPAGVVTGATNSYLVNRGLKTPAEAVLEQSIATGLGGIPIIGALAKKNPVVRSTIEQIPFSDQTVLGSIKNRLFNKPRFVEEAVNGVPYNKQVGISPIKGEGTYNNYVRVGENPGEIISDTGKTFNVGENINTKDLVNDANAYQKFYEKIDPDDLVDMIDEGEIPYWLAGKRWKRIDDIDEALYNNLTGDLNSIPDSYIGNLDKDAKIAYGNLEPFENKSSYSHFSKTPLSNIERGYTGGEHGDNLLGGPTSGVYMVDKGIKLKSPYMKYENEISGPSNDMFINGDLTFSNLPKDLKKILLKKGDLTTEDVADFASARDVFDVTRKDYPFLNRLLRSKGYAGMKRMHEPYYGRDEFTEYLGFYPEDFNIVNVNKIQKGKKR